MDDEETGSARYLTGDAWLRSVIADSWAVAHEQAQEEPFFETAGLCRIWQHIAANALQNEVLH
jgi:hypothetical protein